MEKKAFSLMEVIVATSILSISVFWVYKMIWENNKIINNSNNYLNKTLLFPIIETCIEKSWITSWVNYIYLWNDLKLCDTQATEISNNIDNINYTLIASLRTNLPSSKIWDISIEDDFSWTSSWIYVQKQ